jgi:hypothetical protein
MMRTAIATETYSRLTLEAELLIACARVEATQTMSVRIKALVQQNIDWDLLLQLSQTHAVTPLVYFNLKKTCADQVPKHYLEQLQKIYQLTTTQNLSFTQELLRLLKLFNEQHIPAVPFKGPLLALTAYGNLSLRQISDLDILVHEDDFLKAKELLISNGYRLEVEHTWESHFFGQNGKYNVDLHSLLVPKLLAYALPSTAVWQQTTLTQFKGVPIRTFNAEMQLFMLCLNGNKECWLSLNRICDVAQLLETQEIDWQMLMQWANANGWRRFISIGLSLASGVLEVELPENVQQWLQIEPTTQLITCRIKQQLFSQSTKPMNDVMRTLFHMQTRERFQDKFGAFFGLITQSLWFTPTVTDRTFVKLPASLFFLYYLIRPVRVLGKYWHHVWDVI